MFAKGVDMGWASQLEEQGVRWIDDDGRTVDVYEMAGRLGADSARLRVFVDPPRIGYWQKRDGSVCMLGRCSRQDLTKQAQRVIRAGLRLMVDIHYSDHFADPEYQEIPSDWLLDDADGLEERVREHTAQVLTDLKDVGVTPEWVQVGNEINNGLLIPAGGLKTHPKELVRFLNAGYEAVKAADPQIKVVTHLASLRFPELCGPFLENFVAEGGKTDILGFSYYPFWDGRPHDAQEFGRWARHYAGTYGKPVMIAEIGGEETDPEGTRTMIRECIQQLQQLPNGQGCGIFYWEPEIGAGLLPDTYPLGAARIAGEKTLQFTQALKGYLD